MIEVDIPAFALGVVDDLMVVRAEANQYARVAEPLEILEGQVESALLQEPVARVAHLLHADGGRIHL